MKPSPLRSALLSAVGALVAFIAVSLVAGDSVRIGTLIGAALGCAVLPLLAYHPGPLEERTGIVGGAVLTIILVSAALWLHV